MRAGPDEKGFRWLFDDNQMEVSMGRPGERMFYLSQARKPEVDLTRAWARRGVVTPSLAAAMPWVTTGGVPNPAAISLAGSLVGRRVQRFSGSQRMLGIGRLNPPVIQPQDGSELVEQAATPTR